LRANPCLNMLFFSLDDLLSIGVNVFVLKTLYTKVVRFSYYQGVKDSRVFLKDFISTFNIYKQSS